MSVSFERFVDHSYRLTGDLIEVPHLGGTAKERLAPKITSTYQLIAHYLEFRAADNSIESLATWLKDNGAPATHCRRIAESIDERVRRVGIKVTVPISAGIIQSSRMTDDKARDCLSRRFNNKLEHDFQGLGFGQPGKPSDSVGKVKLNAGIDSTDKLFAAFLKSFSGAPTAEEVDEFYHYLGRIGVSHGYRATVTEAIKLKLAAGLDGIVQGDGQRLGAVAEGQEPRTPERQSNPSATTPVTGGAATRVRARATTIAQTRSSESTPMTSSTTSSSGLSKGTVILFGAVLVAVCARFMMMGGDVSNALPAPQEGDWV